METKEEEEEEKTVQKRKQVSLPRFLPFSRSLFLSVYLLLSASFILHSCSDHIDKHEKEMNSDFSKEGPKISA